MGLRSVFPVFACVAFALIPGRSAERLRFDRKTLTLQPASWLGDRYVGPTSDSIRIYNPNPDTVFVDTGRQIDPIPAPYLDFNLYPEGSPPAGPRIGYTGFYWWNRWSRPFPLAPGKTYVLALEAIFACPVCKRAASRAISDTVEIHVLLPYGVYSDTLTVITDRSRTVALRPLAGAGPGKRADDRASDALGRRFSRRTVAR